MRSRHKKGRVKSFKCRCWRPKADQLCFKEQDETGKHELTKLQPSAQTFRSLFCDMVHLSQPAIAMAIRDATVPAVAMIPAASTKLLLVLQFSARLPAVEW